MKAIAIAVMIIIIACTVSYAKDKYCVIDKEPKATEPVGAVVETVGVFVGKIASATEIAFTGERKITVENETGECKIFPFCATTKVADEAFHTATFNQLKKGEKVRVEYKEELGVAKVDKVTIESSAEKATPATATK